MAALNYNNTPASWSPSPLPQDTNPVSGGGPGLPRPAQPVPKNPNRTAPSKLKAPKPPPKKKVVKKRKPSVLDKYLAGDTTYQQQLAEFNRSRADYNTTYNTEIAQTNRDYNNTRRQMQIQGQKDRMDQQEEFGGRGILHSGVYAKALSDYNTEYNTQMKNLATGLSDKLGNFQQERTSFLNQLKLQMNAARQEAIRRRAAKLGI